MFIQHIDNGVNVMIIELYVMVHLDHISLPQIVSINHDTSAWKIFSPEHAVLSSVVTFRGFLFRHVVTLYYDYCCIMRKISQCSYTKFIGILISTK